MHIFTTTSLGMNLCTNIQLLYMLQLHRLPWLHIANTLGILVTTRVISVVAGISTNPAARVVSDLIITAFKAHGRAPSSAIRGRIHAANSVKPSSIQLPIVLNSSREAMANNLMPIWCSAISHPVLLIGF